jgi:hypothetical protein
MKRRWITTLFVVAALYDGILGIVMLIAPGAIYSFFQVTPPNHWAYVQFPAGLVIVFALLFWAVARAPEANRNLIPYGILLKVCYCSVTFGWWIARGIPAMWKPFAILDLAFMVLFVWAYASLGHPSRVTAAQSA